MEESLNAYYYMTGQGQAYSKMYHFGILITQNKRYLTDILPKNIPTLFCPLVLGAKETSLSPGMGHLEPRMLCKQPLLLFTNLLPLPKFCLEFLTNWHSQHCFLCPVNSLQIYCLLCLKSIKIASVISLGLNFIIVPLCTCNKTLVISPVNLSCVNLALSPAGRH